MAFSFQQTKKWSTAKLLGVLLCVAASPLVIDATTSCALAAEERAFLDDFNDINMVRDVKQRVAILQAEQKVFFSPIIFGTEQKKSAHNTGHLMQELYSKMAPEDVANFNKVLASLKEDNTLEVSKYITHQIVEKYHNILLLLNRVGMERDVAKSMRDMLSFYELGKTWLSLGEINRAVGTIYEEELGVLTQKNQSEKQKLLDASDLQIALLSGEIEGLESTIDDPSINAASRSKLQTQWKEKKIDRTAEETKKTAQETLKNKELEQQKAALKAKYDEIPSIFQGMCSPYGSYGVKGVPGVSLFGVSHRGDSLAFHKLESQITDEQTLNSTVTLLRFLLNKPIRSGHGLLNQTASTLGEAQSCINYITPVSKDMTGYILFSLLGVEPDLLREVTTSIQTERLEQVNVQLQDISIQSDSVSSNQDSNEDSNEDSLSSSSQESIQLAPVINVSPSPHIMAATPKVKAASASNVKKKSRGKK